MNPRAALVALVVFAPLMACGDDGVADVDLPPEVTVTAEPTDGAFGTATTIGFEVTDDRGLQVVSLSWGTLDAPVEILQPSGRTLAATRSHTYGEIGTYTVTVSATDSSGRATTASRTITIQPMGAGS